VKDSRSGKLLEKIEARSAAIGVIGLGYVGLPLAIEFARAGFPVTGFDLDQEKVEKIRAGRSYIKHIPPSAVQALLREGVIPATDDFRLLKKMDCILICVPTPLTSHQEPDLSYIQATVDTIALTLRPGQLVILESTTYPGTTREVVQPVLEETGLTAGKDFFLAFSPEREDPGNPDFATASIPKVVGGLNRDSLRTARKLYEAIVPATIPVSSPDAAEATKLLENIYRSINIALVNELKIVFEKMGIDIWEVIAAASSKPFGYTPFYPGPGLGGHCIPIDPFYLTWRAKEFDLPTRFIQLAGEINTAMPGRVIDRLREALNEAEKSLKGSRVLILGVAYKRDVDDMRESPALRLIELLRAAGARVSYHDPYIPVLPQTRKYRFRMRSRSLTPELLRGADAVLIATDHRSVDYRLVGRHARLVVDTRNAMASAGRVKARVVRA
jgi:UDP-N-acetyl-D-glucosamine dehydrogenase